jgi:hypothetical protein
VLADVFDTPAGEIDAVRLQEVIPGAGRTDVEIEAGDLHLIVEAKRGWNLPSSDQLELYAPRFAPGRQPVIGVISECSAEFADPRLPAQAGGVPVDYLPWSRVVQIVRDVAETGGVGHAEKRLLRELLRYLKGVMTLQDPTSNMVYVVSLGAAELFGSGLSFADIVTELNVYFHPVGGGRGGWPKTPPNYLGFRFHGRLQRICHVESYDVLLRPWDTVPALQGKPDWPEQQHFLYHLGPPIAPAQEVKGGKVTRSLRVWAALDLLLTSETVSEARDRTRERIEAVGAR